MQNQNTFSVTEFCGNVVPVLWKAIHTFPTAAVSSLMEVGGAIILSSHVSLALQLTVNKTKTNKNLFLWSSQNQQPTTHFSDEGINWLDEASIPRLDSQTCALKNRIN